MCRIPLVEDACEEFCIGLFHWEHLKTSPSPPVKGYARLRLGEAGRFRGESDLNFNDLSPSYPDRL
jgi:hypothetical protein